MNRYVLRNSLLLTLGLALLSGCAPARQAAPGATAAIPVSAYHVRARDLPETLLLPGRIMPRQQTPILAIVPGRVQSVSVNVGDHVTSGQLLAVIDSPSSQISLQEARQALRSLETQSANLQRSPLGALPPAMPAIGTLETELQQRLHRLVSLMQTRDLNDTTQLVQTSQDLVRLQSELAQAQVQQAVSKQLESVRAPLLQGMQVQVLQAKQAVRLAEQQVQAARVTAPFDGVVLAKTATAGSPAGPGVPLFTVGDVSQVQFEMLVDPAVQSKLQPGQSVQIQVGEPQPVNAQLTGVSPAPDPTAKSFTATAEIPNPQGRYKPGMIGQATVTLAPHQGVLAVPTAAVQHDDKSAYVMKIVSGNAQKQPVETGYDNGTWTEIRTGLTADSTIIVEGITRAQHGTPVVIVRTETQT